MGEIRKNKHKKVSGVSCWCNFDEMVDIDSLVPNPRNPNTHPKRQIELLSKIIKHQGWRQPITISNRSGFIVKGHGRLMAANALNLEQVPVEYQDYEKEADEYADLIADNKIAELADINIASLDNLLADPLFDGFDLELAGISDDSTDNIGADDNLDLSDTIDVVYRVEIRCKDEAQQEEIYNEMIERGLECKLLTL